MKLHQFKALPCPNPNPGGLPCTRCLHSSPGHAPGTPFPAKRGRIGARHGCDATGPAGSPHPERGQRPGRPQPPRRAGAALGRPSVCPSRLRPSSNPFPRRSPGSSGWDQLLRLGARLSVSRFVLVLTQNAERGKGQSGAQRQPGPASSDAIKSDAIKLGQLQTPAAQARGRIPSTARALSPPPPRQQRGQAARRGPRTGPANLHRGSAAAPGAREEAGAGGGGDISPGGAVPGAGGSPCCRSPWRGRAARSEARGGGAVARNRRGGIGAA